MNVAVGQWCILLVQSCVQSPGKADISVRDVAVGVGRRKQCEGFTIYVTQ